jgi:RNA-directed DNA polymerase
MMIGQPYSGKLKVRLDERRVDAAESDRRLPPTLHFVICFELQADAERVMKALPQRMARYRLALHPDKTRLLEFRPPTQGGEGGPTFDFLGFTIHWQKTRRGRWRMGCRTRRARIRRAIKAAIDWCRGHRHKPVASQHATLTRKLRGHYNYFGVNGNMRCLQMLLLPIKRGWKKWLGRRSQRGYMSWERFAQMLKRYPLPEPRIVVQIWSR